ncbi:hypothetical protein BESB_077000 [Besnoitia besnoiti]|uniref:Uncharacterized protein n=1 Tax=Besnoitia besnoiti TaxID=94643 RepID=A0A2A9MCU0_BESBE|nr:hypothetical protein BESB_077000 [Besnoitia besnoiti]PFH33483.1 hypothetical protein BESB_077000 [Besnoitia besnoiti]
MYAVAERLKTPTPAAKALAGNPPGASLYSSRASDQDCVACDLALSQSHDEAKMSAPGLPLAAAPLPQRPHGGSLRTVSCGDPKAAHTGMFKAPELSEDARGLHASASSALLVSSLHSAATASLSARAASLSSLLGQVSRCGDALQQLQTLSARRTEAPPPAISASPAQDFHVEGRRGGAVSAGKEVGCMIARSLEKSGDAAELPRPRQAFAPQAHGPRDALQTELERLRSELQQQQEELTRQRDRNQVYQTQLRELHEQLASCRETLQPVVTSLSERFVSLRTQTQEHETLLSAQRQVLMDQQQVLQAEVLELTSFVSGCEAAFKGLEEREAGLAAELDKKICVSQAQLEQEIQRDRETHRQEISRLQDKQSSLQQLPALLEELAQRIEDYAATQKETQIALQAELCQSHRDLQTLRGLFEDAQAQRVAQREELKRETLHLLEEHKQEMSRLVESQNEVIRAQEQRIKELQCQAASSSASHRAQSEHLAAQMKDVLETVEALRAEAIARQQNADRSEGIDEKREAAANRCCERERQLQLELKTVRQQQQELVRMHEKLQTQPNNLHMQADRFEKRLEDVKRFVAEREADAQKHYLDLMAALSRSPSSPWKPDARPPTLSRPSQKEVAFHAALLLRCTFDAIHAAAAASVPDDSSPSSVVLLRTQEPRSPQRTPLEEAAPTELSSDAAAGVASEEGQTASSLGERLSSGSTMQRSRELQTFARQTPTEAPGMPLLGECGLEAVRLPTDSQEGAAAPARTGEPRALLSPQEKMEFSSACSTQEKSAADERSLALTELHAERDPASVCSTRHTTTSATPQDPLGACSPPTTSTTSAQDQQVTHRLQSASAVPCGAWLSAEGEDAAGPREASCLHACAAPAKAAAHAAAPLGAAPELRGREAGADAVAPAAEVAGGAFEEGVPPAHVADCEAVDRTAAKAADDAPTRACAALRQGASTDEQTVQLTDGREEVGAARDPSSLLPVPAVVGGNRGSGLWGGEGRGERMEWRIDNFIETLRSALESGTDSLWSPFFSFNGVQELQMQFLPNVLTCLSRGEELSLEEKLDRVLEDRACICGLFLWSSSPRVFECTLCIGKEKRKVVMRPPQRPGQTRSSSAEPCNAALWEHFDAYDNSLTVGVTDFTVIG